MHNEVLRMKECHACGYSWSGLQDVCPECGECVDKEAMLRRIKTLRSHVAFVQSFILFASIIASICYIHEYYARALRSQSSSPDVHRFILIFFYSTLLFISLAGVALLHARDRCSIRRTFFISLLCGCILSCYMLGEFIIRKVVFLFA